MDLIRDVLDKQLIDNKLRKIGKVDGLIIVLDDEGPPRIVFIEVGVVTLARRLSRRFAALLEKLMRRFGISEEPCRIPWTDALVTGIDVFVPIDAKNTRALAWERWLNRRIIRRIPGA